MKMKIFNSPIFKLWGLSLLWFITAIGGIASTTLITNLVSAANTIDVLCGLGLITVIFTALLILTVFTFKTLFEGQKG